MVKIQILGTGCPKCNKLTEITERTAQELGIDYHLEKVTDINQIMDFGVMMTPALVVNGEVVIIGRVPTMEELKPLLN
ncbi:TM0996/MTH895 family glutaredoxin-like protein [candidate division KSB1 bacterium]|nr:TM0996/MTH895 family glutaredoxin-like protein [candidate division KSB1 bacterium]